MSSKPHIVVAMSGGVDSSVTAALLAREGCRITGMSMHIARYGHDGQCAPDLLEARRVAELLGIPHVDVDLVADFEREILEDFTREYARGRTPNPCVRCNRTIKFGAMWRRAAELGADILATGHYARIERRGERLALRMAVDPRKDQSYFLSALTQDDLGRARFPLGGREKSETRQLARDLGLPNAEKPGSKEVCFAPDADYKKFLEERLGAAEPGPIVSMDGSVLGEHRGLMYYTVGQRKGLGIASTRPLFVVRLDPEANSVIVGHREDTYSRTLTASHANWGAIAPPDSPVECQAQIRYNQRPLPCTVYPLWDGNAEMGAGPADGFRVVFDEPVSAIAPGQWAVLYDGEYVLGNGVIEQFEPATVEAG